VRIRLVLVALALLALPSGCGGGSETTPAAVLRGLDRGAFVARADRVCVEGRKRLILAGNRAFGELPADRKPSDAAVSAFAHREAIPILTRQYGRLRGLRPPAADKRQIERILALAELGIRQLRADPTLLNRGDGIPPALRRARELAFLYGLGACGQPIQRPTAGSSLSP
jgi:hypothetical protein